MADQRLNALMMLSFEKDITDILNIDDLVHQGSPNFFIEEPQKISNALSEPKVY
jgi:hypothetical protein